MEKLDLHEEKQNDFKQNKAEVNKEKTKVKNNKTYNENIDQTNTNPTNLLGRKLNKEDKKVIKSINKLSMQENDELNESSSEYIEDSDSDEVYESASSHSDDYKEDNFDKLVNTNNKSKGKKKELAIWDEKNTKMDKDEEVVFDNSAYEMLHRSNVTWPCFSIDWVLPEYFDPQPVKNFYNPIKKFRYPDEFPYTCYFVAGAQTSEKHGYLYYMKWFNMQRTLYDEDPDKEGDSDSEGAEPLMENIAIQSRGNVNKVKTMKNSYITAYWSDLGTLELVDLRSHIEAMENRWTDDTDKKNKKRKVDHKDCHVKSFKRKKEGFALEWSPFLTGVFAAGGYDNEIKLYIPVDEMCSDYVESETNSYSFNGSIKGAHEKGVEALVFSPQVNYLLASSGNDKAIRIWDLRQKSNTAAINLNNAHKSDVNCIDWKSSTGAEMIASGSDDSTIKLWDPRKMSSPTDYIANIEFHKDPITSLNWDPLSPCQLAVTSEDNRLTLWDFSVEPDSTKVKDVVSNKDIPDQLVFLHQGQENLKDVKFHPYYDSFLLSTAESGINCFKPNFNDDEESENDEDNFTFNK